MKTKKITSKMFIPIITAIVAIVFAYLGYFKYGFWHSTKGTLPGFFPVIISLFLFVISIIVFIATLKEEDTHYPIQNWYPAIGVTMIIICTLIIGMLPSLAIFVLVWLKWYEKYSWKTTITVFLIIMGIVIGAFVIWLGVPFPKGVIFEMVFN